MGYASYLEERLTNLGERLAEVNAEINREIATVKLPPDYIRRLITVAESAKELLDQLLDIVTDPRMDREIEIFRLRSANTELGRALEEREARDKDWESQLSQEKDKVTQEQANRKKLNTELSRSRRELQERDREVRGLRGEVDYWRYRAINLANQKSQSGGGEEPHPRPRTSKTSPTIGSVDL